MELITCEPDLLLTVFSHCDGYSLSQCELVCVFWKNLIFEGKCWYKLLLTILKDDALAETAFNALESSRVEACSTGLNIYKEFVLGWLSGGLVLLAKMMENKPKIKKKEVRGRVWAMGDDRERGVVFVSEENEVFVYNDSLVNEGEALIGEVMRMNKLGMRGNTVVGMVVVDKVVITVSLDTTIRVWQFVEKDWRCDQVIFHHKAYVNCVASSGATIVTGSWDETLAVWTLQWGRLNFVCNLQGHEGQVEAVDVNEEIIVSGSVDRTLRIWNTSLNSDQKSLGKHLGTLEGHKLPITCVAIIPKVLNIEGQFDKYVASGSRDETVMIWDVLKFSCARILPHASSVTCLVSQHRLLLTGDRTGRLVVWNTRNLRQNKGSSSSLSLSSPLSGDSWEPVFKFETRRGFVKCVSMVGERIISGHDIGALVKLDFF